MNLFSKLIKSIFNIQKFNHPNSKYHREAKKLLQEYTAEFDLSKDPKVPFNALSKMQWYMAEFIYSAEMLNEVKGIKSSSSQRRNYLLSGAVVAICDLIIDDLDLELAEIKALKRPSKNSLIERDIFKLYSLLYHTFFDSLGKSAEAVRHYYELLYEAQIESIRQFDPKISKTEVDRICIEKGGYSLLYIRAMLEGEINELEERTWYEVGGYIQFCNDAQDLYKDLKNKLRTFGTCRTNLTQIANDLDQQRMIAFSLLKKCPFKTHNKDFLLFTLYSMGVGIIAKLYRYHLLCKKDFSLETLTTLLKDEVRSQLQAKKLVGYWLPRVINYRYKNCHEAYNFDFKLKNSHSTH
ncbi:MAG: hypothetical protein RIC95_05770 [Vicingaceae bacterium]